MKFKEILQDLFGRVQIDEKQILFNQGEDYGQAVFVAGGAGSGKSFAIDNFMQRRKFRVFNVDRWKKLFLRINDELDKYPELDGLNLRDPDDVYKLHRFVKDRNIKVKAFEAIFGAADPRRLPNVIFDVTMKDFKNLDLVVPMLYEAGYERQNVHLVWVLTDYYLAIKRNRNRDRIVPDDIVLKTHEGAARTMIEIFSRGLPYNMDGSVHVILGNAEETEFHDKDARGRPVNVPDSSKELEKAVRKVVEDFTYLTLKNSGEAFMKRKEVMEQLHRWIVKNIPRSVSLRKARGIMP